MTLVRDKKTSAAAPDARPATAYEDDGYTWALEQAALLKAARFDMIDVANIADEITDVAKREAKATRSALRLVLHHLLTWDHQPARRGRSWALTIRTQRRAVDRQLHENPGCDQSWRGSSPKPMTMPATPFWQRPIWRTPPCLRFVPMIGTRS